MNDEEKQKLLKEPIDKKLLLEIAGKICYSKAYNLLLRHCTHENYETILKLDPNNYPTKKQLTQLWHENNSVGKRRGLQKKPKLVLERYLKTIEGRPDDYLLNEGVLVKMGMNKNKYRNSGNLGWTCKNESYAGGIIRELKLHMQITNEKVLKTFGQNHIKVRNTGNQTRAAILEYLSRIGLNDIPSFPAIGFGISYRNLPVSSTLDSLLQNNPKATESAQIVYLGGNGDQYKQNIFSIGITQSPPTLLYCNRVLVNGNHLRDSVNSLPLARIIKYNRSIKS